jgi:myosin heavy chain 6/7
LALTSEERIKLQSQPFDAKKQCWAPDPKESFVAGEITATKGEEVTIKTDKGDVCTLITIAIIDNTLFYRVLQ